MAIKDEIGLRVVSISFGSTTWNATSGAPLDFSVEDSGEFHDESIAEKVGIGVMALKQRRISVTVTIRKRTALPAVGTSGTLTIVEQAASGSTTLTYTFSSMIVREVRVSGPGTEAGRTEIVFQQEADTPSWSVS